MYFKSHLNRLVLNIQAGKKCVCDDNRTKMLFSIICNPRTLKRMIATKNSSSIQNDILRYELS